MSRIASAAFIALVIAALIVGISPASVAAPTDAEKVNTNQLMLAAIAAHSAGQIEDAGYFFVAAQARYQIDKQSFPPVQKGGNNPGVLMASLSFSAGQPIMNSVTSDRDINAKVISRLSHWSPMFEANYDPGWEFENPLDSQDRQKVVATVCTKILNSAQQRMNLLNHDEYSRLSKDLQATREVEQRYWAAIEANRGLDIPDKGLISEYKAAQVKKKVSAKRMKDIEWEINPTTRWHTHVGWQAEDYFEDPKSIELCHAIEKNDITAMEQLIASGADVNSIGKQGMTPLLWAFPDHKPERFVCLLKHGANPNIFLESDFGTNNLPFHPYPEGGRSLDDRGCHAGQTVTHLACRSPVIEYMRQVFQHGGDAMIVDKKTKEVPLDIVLDRSLTDVKSRVEILIAKGADVNRFCDYTLQYPVTQAVHYHKYDVALLLLEAGADPNATRRRDESKIVHTLLRHELDQIADMPEFEADFRALVDWLKEHGQSFEEARADLEQDGTWQKLIQKKKQHELFELQARQQAEARADRTGTLPPAATNQVSVKPPSELVKSISDLQRERISLSSDVESPVFTMSLPTATPRKEPWMSVYANGRLICHGRLSPAASPVEAKISPDELKWLLHLAVNECKLLERESQSYPAPKRNIGKGAFNYMINVKSGSNDLQLPMDYLIVKTRRRDSGLDNFKLLNMFATGIVNQAIFTDFEGSAEILQKINDDLNKNYPGRPPFQLQHLALADRFDSSTFVCSFEHEIFLGDHRFEKLTGVFTAKGDETKVQVNALEYSKLSR